jgi:beta-galactosidase
MLPHGGENTRAHQEAVQLGAELARLGAVCGSRSKAEIGLIVDWESLWAMQLDPRRGGLDYQELVLSYYRALFEPDPAIDIVQPEADLTHYKLVVAPGLYLVRDGVAENLAHFVANGGTLVMSIFSGIVDSSHRVLTGGFPAPFRRVLGIHIEEMESIPPDVVRHVRAPGNSAKCARWADVIQLEGAEAVATFTETFYAGRPAITRNAFGRGLAYYLGTQVDPDFLRGFFVGICDEIGIRPQFKVPAGVEAVARENEEGRFLFLLNHSPNSQLIELGGHEGRDMLTDELLEGQFQIPPGGVRVVHLV